MKRFYFIIIMLVISQLSFAQDGLPENREPNKCYAKCLHADMKEVKSIKIIPIYLGDDKENQYVENVKLCFQNEKGEKMCDSFRIVTNTIEERDFEDREILLVLDDELIPKDTQWHEVICDTKITTTLLMTIHDKLVERGFAHGAYVSELILKQNLRAFQISTKGLLPIGKYDIETLVSLGVVKK